MLGFIKCKKWHTSHMSIIIIGYMLLLHAILHWGLHLRLTSMMHDAPVSVAGGYDHSTTIQHPHLSTAHSKSARNHRTIQYRNAPPTSRTTQHAHAQPTAYSKVAVLVVTWPMQQTRMLVTTIQCNTQAQSGSGFVSIVITVRYRNCRSYQV